MTSRSNGLARLRFPAFLASLAACGTLATAQTTYTIDPGNDPTANPPLHDIAAFLASGTAVDGDVIRVNPGTYGPIVIDDSVPDVLTIEAALPQAEENYIIDAGGIGTAVTFDDPNGNKGNDFVLEGFTIKRGAGTFEDPYTAPGLPLMNLDLVGGGIYIEGSAPTIKSCHITDNDADHGAGIFLKDAPAALASPDRPLIYGCRIDLNTAVNGGGGVYSMRSRVDFEYTSILSNTVTGATSTFRAQGAGGGVFTHNDLGLARSETTFFQCEIRDNVALDSFAGNGGGIFTTAGVDPADTSRFQNALVSLVQTEVTGNQAGWNGGGIYMRSDETTVENPKLILNLDYCYVFNNASGEQGGGVYLERQAASRWSSTQFVENVSGFGGGAFLFRDGDNNSIELDNCLFAYNQAFGGGLFVGGTAAARIQRSTFAFNDDSGLELAFNSGEVTVDSCIFWGNLGSQILATSNISVDYSDWQGGSTLPTPSIYSTGTGNIDQDPMFVTGDPAVNQPDRRFFLSHSTTNCSPCVDTGNPDTLRFPLDSTETTMAGPDPIPDADDGCDCIGQPSQSGCPDMGFHYGAEDVPERRAYFSLVDDFVPASGDPVAVFEVDAGAGSPSRILRVAGSLRGTSPGFQFLGAFIPLWPDGYTQDAYKWFFETSGNHQSTYVLPADGRMTLHFKLDLTNFAPITLYHAYVIFPGNFQSIEDVSNPTTLRVF